MTYLQSLFVAVVLALFFTIGVAFTNPAPAQAAWCGLKPMRPLGCINGYTQCICTRDGCTWIWVCN